MAPGSRDLVITAFALPCSFHTVLSHHFIFYPLKKPFLFSTSNLTSSKIQIRKGLLKLIKVLEAAVLGNPLVPSWVCLDRGETPQEFSPGAPSPAAGFGIGVRIGVWGISQRSRSRRGSPGAALQLELNRKSNRAAAPAAIPALEPSKGDFSHSQPWWW